MQEQEGSEMLDAVPTGAVEEELIGHGTAAAIREMRLRGKSKKAIARELDLDIKTVRKWASEEWKPQRRRAREEELKAYEEVIAKRFPEVGYNAEVMYRELQEEVGLSRQHVKVLGRTRDWLRYDVPEQWIRRDWRGNYKGQKQIWYLLRLVGRDCDVHLRASEKPEFDAWRWNDYWVPLESVIEFKRKVYQQALNDLARYLHRHPQERRASVAGAR